MIANTYVIHLSCPVCGGELHHVKQIDQLDGSLGAYCYCPDCDTDVTLTVEMSHKRRHVVGAQKMTKLPLGPLMSHVGCETANQFGALTGLGRTVVQRLKSDGVPIMRADELAVMCGVHPTTIWGDSYYQALELIT